MKNIKRKILMGLAAAAASLGLVFGAATPAMAYDNWWGYKWCLGTNKVYTVADFSGYGKMQLTVYNPHTGALLSNVWKSGGTWISTWSYYEDAKISVVSASPGITITRVRAYCYN